MIGLLTRAADAIRRPDQVALLEADLTLDRAARALDDPGAVVPRAYGEPKDEWAARAVLAILCNQEDDR